MTNNKLTDNVCGICADCVPQIDGGSGFNNCKEAHEAQLAEDASMNNKLTDEQLKRLIIIVKRSAFQFGLDKNEVEQFKEIHSALTELQERRKADREPMRAGLTRITFEMNTGIKMVLEKEELERLTRVVLHQGGCDVETLVVLAQRAFGFIGGSVD